MGAYAIVRQEDFANARGEFERFIEQLGADRAMAMRHDEVERLAVAEGRRVALAALQDHLALRAVRESRQNRVEGADDVTRTHIRPRTRGLLTILGPVKVERLAYSARGTSSLAPLDAELNLPIELYSFEVRRVAAIEASKGSFDEAMATLGAMTGAPVPKRQIEELAARAAVDFEAFYKQQPATPATAADLLVLTFDGKGIAMLRKALREATRRADEERRHKLDKRLCKGEKKNKKRMAQVAAVYDVAPFPRRPSEVVFDLKPEPGAKTRKRPRAQNKRVWASILRDPVDVVVDAFEEAERRDPDHQRRWVALVDGNKTQIDLIERCAKQCGVEVTLILDVIHVLEYLWKAGLCFCKEGSSELEQWVTERLLRILEGHSSDVAGGINRSATKRGLDANDRKNADACADYLIGYKEMLRYDEFLSDGLPIATGVIEGACRHLIQDRMGRTGARWGLDGAEAILRLRSLRSSGDFDDYWRFHLEQEHRRNHAAHYAAMPTPSQEGRPKLRLVHGGASS